MICSKMSDKMSLNCFFCSTNNPKIFILTSYETNQRSTFLQLRSNNYLMFDIVMNDSTEKSWSTFYQLISSIAGYCLSSTCCLHFCFTLFLSTFKAGRYTIIPIIPHLQYTSITLSWCSHSDSIACTDGTLQITVINNRKECVCCWEGSESKR